MLNVMLRAAEGQVSAVHHAYLRIAQRQALERSVLAEGCFGICGFQPVSLARGLDDDAQGRALKPVSAPRGRSGSAVGAAEQVAERLPAEQRSPAPPLMLWPVVDHMAPLAEGREVGVRVVRGVVIPVGRR
jgi:hypothetical protein